MGESTFVGSETEMSPSDIKQLRGGCSALSSSVCSEFGTEERRITFRRAFGGGRKSDLRLLCPIQDSSGLQGEWCPAPRFEVTPPPRTRSRLPPGTTFCELRFAQTDFGSMDTSGSRVWADVTSALRCSGRRFGCRVCAKPTAGFPRQGRSPPSLLAARQHVASLLRQDISGFPPEYPAPATSSS